MKFMKEMFQLDLWIISSITIICHKISMFKNIQFIKLMWGCRIHRPEEALAVDLIFLQIIGLIVQWHRGDLNSKLLFKINREEPNLINQAIENTV